MSILEILEESDLEYIRELSQDIGLYRSVAETFPEDQEIQDRCRVAINYNQYQIEETMENYHDRRIQAEQIRPPEDL